MTTFHSDNLVSRADLHFIFADACEPDSISVEAWQGDKQLFSLSIEETGRRSIRFWFPQDIEFDAVEFRDLISEAMVEAERWEASLRIEGGAWSEEVMRDPR